MATYDNMQTRSYVASADLSAKRYYFVKMHSVAEQIALCGNGENAIGVLQDKPISGQAGAVGCSGKMPVQAGDTFAAGAKLASDADGKAVPAATGDHVLGVAATAGAAGSLAEIEWSPQGILAA